MGRGLGPPPAKLGSLRGRAPQSNPPRPPGLRACRASVLVLPTLLFYGRFPVGSSSRTKVAGFASSSPSELHATASKPRTGLRTRPSAAKCFQELDFDIKKSLAPPKSVENDE